MTRRRVELPPALQRYFTQAELDALQDFDPEQHKRVYDLLDTLPHEVVLGALAAAMMHSDDPIEEACRLCNVANHLKLLRPKQ